MDHKAVIPAALKSYYDWKMSPGLISGDHVFLTGFTGTGADGRCSADPETQFRTAFGQVEMVLREAGLDFFAVVEMTTYHIGLRVHLDLFRAVRSEFVGEPYPAWTAIEVSGFASADTIIEIRVVARTV
ncbi:MAG: Rid family hydrolase [Thalassobaculaceae bacterium]|nr:Rid family hydrolase [Thalassobaculaceae bacterium]